MELEAGDRLRILTPGGGGYGPPGADAAMMRALKRRRVGGEGSTEKEEDAGIRRVVLKGSVEEYRSRQETV